MKSISERNCSKCVYCQSIDNGVIKCLFGEHKIADLNYDNDSCDEFQKEA